MQTEVEESIKQEQESQLPKRRRVARACDECRKKKIRCDGRSPCTHCTVYSYKCTFDQPSNRRRNPPPGYVDQLERKCDKYRRLLERVAPDIDLEDAADSSDGEDGLFGLSRRTDTGSNSNLDSDATSVGENAQSMESMFKTLELNRDHQGNVDYRGGSSGTLFVQAVCGQVGWSKDAESAPHDVYGGAPPRAGPISTSHDDLSADGLSNAVKLSAANRQKIDSPVSFEVDEEIQLPSYEVALQLSKLCFERGCVVFQFSNLPQYYDDLKAHYASSEVQDEEDFIPVIYSAMAVGCLFANDDKERFGITDPRLRAFQYFQASKKISDTIDRANSAVIQTLMLQVLFLQSTANMSLCWTYCGVALRTAQRLGLHRNFDDHFSPVERQLRKKQFWSIRNVDTYLHAILGLPKGIDDADIDQGFPLEVDDQYLDKSGVTTQPEDDISDIACANFYSKLCPILADVVQQVYPMKSSNHSGNRSAVSQRTLRGLEDRLNEWDRSLSPVLQHDRKLKDIGVRFYRQSRLLRFSYFHAFVLMYRPFLHYLRGDSDCSNEFRICGEKAKAGALGALKVTEEMLKEDPLAAGHFFAIYATFFAGLTLLYCVIQDPRTQDRAECIRYIDIAKTATRACARSSVAAENSLHLMNELSKQLPSEDTIMNVGQVTSTKDSSHRRTSSTSSLKNKKKRPASTAGKSSTLSARRSIVPQSATSKDPFHSIESPDPASEVSPIAMDHTKESRLTTSGIPMQTDGNNYDPGLFPQAVPSSASFAYLSAFPNYPAADYYQSIFSPQLYSQDTYNPGSGRSGTSRNYNHVYEPQFDNLQMPTPYDQQPASEPNLFAPEWAFNHQLPLDQMPQERGMPGMMDYSTTDPNAPSRGHQTMYCPPQ